MSRVFTLGQDRAQWMSAGFMAAMTISMLTTPWLLDRFGYRNTYFAVVLLLMAGGIGGGLGWSFEWVLAMRVAEGLAAGVLQPIPAIIIMHAFGRARAGQGDRPLRHGRRAGAGGRAQRGRGARRGLRLAFDLLRRRAVLPRRALAGAALPAAQRAGRRRRQPRRQRFDLAGLALLSLAILSLLNGMVHLRASNAGLGAEPARAGGAGAGGFHRATSGARCTR